MNLRIPDGMNVLAVAWSQISADIERIQSSYLERPEPARPVKDATATRIASLEIGAWTVVFSTRYPSDHIATAQRGTRGGVWRARYLGQNAWRVDRIA